MAADTRGERNRPIFAGSGASADAEDLTLLGQLATDLGTRRVGTRVERDALTDEWKFPGLRWYDTTNRAEYDWLDGAWQQVSGTWTGTRTQSVGQGGPSGVGVFARAGGQSSPAADFMSMGGDGRFVLARGSYTMTATMTLTGSRSAGRTFVEIIDVNLAGTGIGRGLIPPGVGEDTVSAALTTWTDGTRQFRVQLIQNSGQIQDIQFRLAVTKVS